MLEVGLHFECMTIVDENKTATALGSGDMAVFATPAMVALMEHTAMLCVAEHLPAGSTTVGTAISVSHTKASPVGAKIIAEARLVVLDGRRMEFRVRACDEQGVVIGEGFHSRYIVDRERFLSKL